MIKFGLIGGTEIKQYTIAEFLWRSMRNVFGVDYEFEISSITDEIALKKFWRQYIGDKNFIGFNVALPYKRSFKNFDSIRYRQDKNIDLINLIFKRNHQIYADNADVHAIYRLLSKFGHLSNKSILILGFGGVGEALAKFLSNRGIKNLFLFDVLPIDKEKQNFYVIDSFYKISNLKYDILINATPHGKLYLKNSFDHFSLPISIKLFESCVKSKSIYLELNYMPLETDMISLAKLLGLRTISGVDVLVHQAVISLENYIGCKFSELQIDELICAIECISNDKEYELLKRSTKE